MFTKLTRIRGVVILSGFLMVAASVLAGQLNSQPALASTSAITTIPESNDFATYVLRDPWDMKEYSDISQYLNDSNQTIVLENISVQNGVFSASANGRKDANFYPLFPGYHTALLYGKIGENFPISSATYKCIYIAMKVDAPVSTPPDNLQVFWFEDDRLNGNPVNGVYGKWGFATDPLSKSGEWNIYFMDLSKATKVDPNLSSWDALTTWKGLRIDPSGKDVDFAVDWIRLTDCKANNYTISAGVNDNVSIKEQGTQREYKLTNNSGSNYTADFQGVAPGVYDILVNGVNKQTIKINQTFIANFESPGFYSGQDYATAQGNAWDFNDASDVKRVDCTEFNFNTPGKLFIRTPQGGIQTPGCYSVIPVGTSADPRIVMNAPAVINPADYRYLTWRMTTEYPSQNVPGGMILRLIWYTDSYTRPNQNFRCVMVSHDMPFDVGTQTYTIDLHDLRMGAVEQAAGDCPPASTLSWSTSKPIIQLRIDPNENMSLGNYPQYFDQIWLTKPNQVKKGAEYPVEIRFNRPVTEISSLVISWVNAASAPLLGHTNSESDQAENQALEQGDTAYTRQVIFPQSSPIEQTLTGEMSSGIGQGGPTNSFFLPVVINNWKKVDGYTHLVYWPTGSMATGAYKICVTVKDSYNTANWCSDAVVYIVP